MPKVPVTLTVKGAPATINTYGSVWALPRQAGDAPVENSVTVRLGATRLTLESGWYAYYFAFTGHQDDDEFSLVMEVKTKPAPAPRSKTFNTLPAGPRVFRFRV